MHPDLIHLKNEMLQELESILSYWETYSVDKMNGGFYGEVNNNNEPVPDAEKGSVLNARILWAFARAYNFTQEKKYLTIAERAYRYIVDFFIDKEYGGVYWTVDAAGMPANTKKQGYAQAFCLYGFSEYYKATKNAKALEKAIDIYKLIEAYSFDKANGGYLEAFSRDWKELDDIRLSEKDQNDRKTMNTHLHIVEAYANLYSIWKEDKLKRQIVQLLENFAQYFINKKSNHLILFFDENWNAQSSTISYGHEIEAAWLLQECAEVIDDKRQIDLMKKYAVLLAKAALGGLDDNGALCYEKGEVLVKEKHWWPQAEAMVGFLNAFEVSGNQVYLCHCLTLWSFIQKNIRAKDGEWRWGLDAIGEPINDHYKVGLWKCPYHNARACIEVAKRIDDI